MIRKLAHSALVLCFLGAIAFSALAQTLTPQMKLIGETTVSRQALTFAIGPAAKFSQTVNGRAHQQTALTTYQGYQYIAFVDAERRVCLGRRNIAKTTWEIIQFEDHTFESNDSHNSAVVGICEKDGTIHLAFDHHATELNYRVSKLGAAHQPDSVEWSADLFGGVTHSLGSVVPASRVTYPRFVSAPNGNLMFCYRAVTSGNGDGMIEEYDGNSHDWTTGLGKFIARDIGTYKAAGRVSRYRCPYINSLSYAGQRLHVSWVWRDRFEKTHPANQHDLCYAYSDDDGRTWRNSAGQVIGRTGTEYIHLDSAGLVVASIPTHSGLTNQNTHYAYADGSIHVVLSQGQKERLESRYHHYWRTKDGIWKHEVLPFSGDRPKLVGSKDGSLTLVYTEEEQLFVAVGLPDEFQNSWQWNAVSLPRAHSIYGEALLDMQRWENEGVLSLYSQQEPAMEIVTDRLEAVDGFPSPLKVVDYRLTATKETHCDLSE